MITKRTHAYTAEHPETGITVQVYQVDCFVEQVSEYGSAFVFEERFFETETGQKVVTQNDTPVLLTGKQNWYLRKV